MPFHDVVVVADKNIADAVHQFVDEQGAKEGYALVHVAYLAINLLFVFEEVLVGFRVEEGGETLLGLGGADYAAVVGVFHVEDKVADVVGGLHHV